jgi:hypothetical protein
MLLPSERVTEKKSEKWDRFRQSRGGVKSSVFNLGLPSCLFESIACFVTILHLPETKGFAVSQGLLLKWRRQQSHAHSVA